MYNYPVLTKCKSGLKKAVSPLAGLRVWTYGLLTFGLSNVALAQDTEKKFKFVKPEEKPELLDGVGTNIVEGGRILLLAISVLAFVWISYSAIAKFRECQKGTADWSELLVLGVAAGAILVFVTILLSSAGTFVDTGETGE